TPSDHLVKIEISDASFFTLVPRHEVLFVVRSEGNDACGMYNGRNIQPGDFHFASVVEYGAPSPNYVKIFAGSWLDSLNVGALPPAPPQPGEDHCFVQMVKVPHFRDMVFTSGASVMGDPFDFGGATGAGG